MVIAPERDVVRVEELAGPRGGRQLVLHLSCGCLLWRSSRLPPPKRARCVPCGYLAAHPDVSVIVLQRSELELLIRLVEVYRLSVRERILHAGVVIDPRTETVLVDGLLPRLERARTDWAKRGGDM